MSLAPGTHLGPYEVVAQIGVGGMGEVYRARDTKLGRDVAIKVLPDVVAQDAERLARFDREAKTLAALNHPGIAAVYGLEESDGIKALVMELVEGPTLADRIAQGPIPVDEGLLIAKQIAEALEAAHEQGVIHRDLKPANVKVRDDGTVKVLDFGLAKALEPAGAVAATRASMSPTITTPAMTQMGMILGTAAYMSPEQAKGQPADKRSDVWAFGCVLYEMLTGRAAFDGETVTEVLANVLKAEPDWSLLPSTLPAPVRALVQSCLTKDRRGRGRSAVALVYALDAPLAPADTSSIRPPTRWPTIAGWTIAAALALVAAVVWWWRPSVGSPDQPLVTFQIDRTYVGQNPDDASRFSLSPDGQFLAYYANVEGAGGSSNALHIRTLASGVVQRVPGVPSFAYGSTPVWSPDSTRLVYALDPGRRVIRMLDLQTLTDRPFCSCVLVDGTWSRDGVILFNRRGGGRIQRVTLDDPSPVDVTTPDTTTGETDRSPVFLPDGRRFLFTRSTPDGPATTYVGTLDGGTETRLTDGSRTLLATGPDGDTFLLGIEPLGLVAQRLDLRTLTVTRESSLIVAGATAASISANGVLATSTAGSLASVVPAWFDRAGTRLGTVGVSGSIGAIALSPDGSRLAVAEDDAIWIRDAVSGARRRVTFGDGPRSNALWSPDGQRLVVVSGGGRGYSVYERSADGTGSERAVLNANFAAFLNDWSPDGRFLLVSGRSGSDVDRNANALFVLPMGDGVTPTPTLYLDNDVRIAQGEFSPDGRFVAYISRAGDDRYEVYVQTFPDAAGGKWQVSDGGGVEPRWAPDGTELFYFSGSDLMAVPVSLEPTFLTGRAVQLFSAPIREGYYLDRDLWQVSPDGRFLLLVPDGTNAAPPLDVVVNWTGLLPRD